MAEFAYACRPCDGRDVTWFVGLDAVAHMPADTQVVQVRVGRDWLCAVLDRSKSHVVESMLVRDAIAATAEDCPECFEESEEAGDQSSQPIPPAVVPKASPTPIASAAPQPAPSGRKILAAAISIGGRNLVVVAAKMDLVRDNVEADLVIDDVSGKFGGVPVVLMAQREDDGMPAYYGDGDLVDLLANVPLEKMPWKEYPMS